MAVWLWTMGAVVFVSLLSLLGIITLTLRQDLLQQALLVLVALSAGALFGDAFLHLLPEQAKSLGFTVESGFLVLLGVVVFFAIERYMHWHHCHSSLHLCDDPHDKAKEHADHITVKPLGWTVLAGDSLHNFVDGAVIAASFLVSNFLGLTTTLAVVFHEIPQEIAHFGVLLHSGFTARQGLFFNFLSALTAVLGGVITLVVGGALTSLTAGMIPFTIGGFVYVAAADLIPELKHEDNTGRSLLHFGAFLGGIGIMAALLLVA